MSSATRFAPEEATKRQKLALLLQQAAELEHSVMCQYLFAAATIKTTHEEGGISWEDLENMRVWHASIMFVARQEMEHLGLVINLLTAIGEAPVLRHRDFPFEVEHGGKTMRLSLEPFSRETVRGFALIEMPDDLERGTKGWRLLAEGDRNFNPEDYDLLAELYDEIDDLIKRLPDETFKIGPADAQFTTADIFPASIRGLSMAGRPAYDVNLHAVLDKKTAHQAVRQIQTEGEGARGHGGEGSHFAVFVNMLEQLDAAEREGFEPGRPSVSNPRVEGEGEGVVTHPVTCRVMSLFDQCYQTLNLALIRYFAHTDDSESDLHALQQAAFFPMMTTIIRPLTECLTMLPAHESGTATAGPAFTFPENLAFLPHRDAAFEILDRCYTQMVRLSRDLAGEASEPGNPLGPFASRMKFVHETLWRSRLNLRRNAGLGEDDE